MSGTTSQPVNTLCYSPPMIFVGVAESIDWSQSRSGAYSPAIAGCPGRRALPSPTGMRGVHAAAQRVASREEWLKERVALLEREKASTRERDEISRLAA